MQSQDLAFVLIVLILATATTLNKLIASKKNEIK